MHPVNPAADVTSQSQLCDVMSRGVCVTWRVSVFLAGDDGDLGVVHHVVADTAQESSLDLAQTPGTRHDHSGALLVRRVHDRLSGFSRSAPDATFDLWGEKYVV